MKNYTKFYKFGKRLPGGGNPLRDFAAEAEAEQADRTDQSFAFERNRDRNAYGADDTLQRNGVPTMNETLHMRPTNNFEEITEDEFDRRERAKAEYRMAL